MAGELLPRWQISAGYTFNENKLSGSGYGTQEGQAFTTISPKHLLKLWTTYALAGEGWLSRLTVGGGANAQSPAFNAGTACVVLNPPNPTTGISSCKTSVPYNYTQKSYAVLAARIDYKLDGNWNVSLNGDNVTDKRYYQNLGSSSGGNWYGTPRNYVLAIRGSF
ncbi:MAG: TonB-dependent receptor [Gammaproteobacteria bacterium]